MAVIISPLELILDTDNPRFVILPHRDQAEIRKYLLTHEDVCPLATDINAYGRLLPGERIVVLRKNDCYVVVEGNRRTCSLQLLLSRELIPDGFAHRIPPTSPQIIENCSNIEVDVLPDRETALGLMTKRHIEGVKQWKPLAKKQFFAATYRDGQGQSIQNLSRITGLRESEIKGDIRDYKFFLKTYETYCSNHPTYQKEIIYMKIDPFWRIFKAKFEYPLGNRTSPSEFLKITYDDTYNTVSSLDASALEQITQLVFEKTIVTEEVNTRHVLSDVPGISPLLQSVYNSTLLASAVDNANNGTDDETPSADSKDDSPQADKHPDSSADSSNDSGQSNDQSGGPRPGGPPPKSFFETISWRDKLNRTNPIHQGLLHSINELYNLSIPNRKGQKAYKTFPIATGMILRTVYEQALRLHLIRLNLWEVYKREIGKGFPMLKSMEDFIKRGENKGVVFSDSTMNKAFDRVIAATHRDFLNANIHSPGDIAVTADSLESIAAGGMYTLIQGIINLL
jgi:hypothetical protein